MSRLRALWWRVRGGLWFIPSLLVAGSVLLALALVALDDTYDFHLQARWPRLFGVGAEGSRSLLSAIATSMLTVAGTVFSITLAVLSLAASQYSPRVLRSFMADRPTQVVLGVFVAVFVYCLLVLRTIRGGDEQRFVPSLAVLGGIVLAFVAVGFLVYFIHHLATSIEASSIIARITSGTRAGLEELFPQELGTGVNEDAEDKDAAEIGAWTPVAASKSGYIVSVDSQAMLGFACRENRVVRMELGIGDFAIEGLPLASLEGDAPVKDETCAALNRCYSFDRQRTIEQDAAFGVRQIVDVGLKALSPGINDESTALLCIDRLAEILVHLARRRIETPYRRDDERLRVIARGPTFGGLLALAVEPLREAGAAKCAVLDRLLGLLERTGSATVNERRRERLALHVGHIAETAHRALRAPQERHQVLERAAEVRNYLHAGQNTGSTPGG